jgi:hypothetical protein
MASQNSMCVRQAKPSASRLSQVPIACHDESSLVSSAGQGREERDATDACSLRAFGGDCGELIHEMANTNTAVLMNARALGWKLPPYSRLKRPLLEIERNAQRGGELMKQLLRRLGTARMKQANPVEPCVQGGRWGLSEATQEPQIASGNAENLPPRRDTPAPGFLSAAEVELTSRCDVCTSTFPKKG